MDVASEMFLKKRVFEVVLSGSELLLLLVPDSAELLANPKLGKKEGPGAKTGHGLNYVLISRICFCLNIVHFNLEEHGMVLKQPSSGH